MMYITLEFSGEQMRDALLDAFQFGNGYGVLRELTEHLPDAVDTPVYRHPRFSRWRPAARKKWKRELEERERGRNAWLWAVSNGMLESCAHGWHPVTWSSYRLERLVNDDAWDRFIVTWMYRRRTRDANTDHVGCSRPAERRNPSPSTVTMSVKDAFPAFIHSWASGRVPIVHPDTIDGHVRRVLDGHGVDVFGGGDDAVRRVIESVRVESLVLLKKRWQERCGTHVCMYPSREEFMRATRNTDTMDAYVVDGIVRELMPYADDIEREVFDAAGRYIRETAIPDMFVEWALR